MCKGAWPLITGQANQRAYRGGGTRRAWNEAWVCGIRVDKAFEDGKRGMIGWRARTMPDAVTGLGWANAPASQRQSYRIF